MAEKKTTDEKKAEDTLKTNKKFFCEKHGHQIVAVIWKNAFVLECGCAYRFDDVRGVRLINSTNRPMDDYDPSPSSPCYT